MTTQILVHPSYQQLDQEALFNAESDQIADGIKGRGQVVFFSMDGQELVRRHYRRGGFISKFVADRYLYTGFERTRMYREYALLDALSKAGLPVPQPVAIRCVRNSMFLYSGDLVMLRIKDAKTLGSLLIREPLGSEAWNEIGATIGRFHKQLVFHADLNVENILIDDRGQVSLLDFDRGRIVGAGLTTHADNNLQRLQRSLLKQTRLSAEFHFTQDDWKILTQSHQKAFRGS